MPTDFGEGILTQLADAVVDTLNREDFKACYEAERKVVSCIEQTQMGDTTFVEVIPSPLIENTLATRRGTQEKDYVISIGVIKQVPNLSNDELDPMIALTERIGYYFPATSVTIRDGSKSTNLTCMNTIVLAPFDPDRLQSELLFQGVVSLTYKFCS
jgi:hypothetical protein